MRSSTRVYCWMLLTTIVLLFIVRWLAVNAGGWLAVNAGGPLYQQENSQDCARSIGNQVFAYDNQGVGIKRKEVLVDGFIKEDKVPLVIGVPTVYREHNNKSAFYLDQTLKSLINPLIAHQKNNLHIVVFLADAKEEKQNFIRRKIKRLFARELRDGLLSIVKIQSSFYGPLEKLTRTFGDTSNRMYWRSKQTLDYVYMFQYVNQLCDYYLQIEDDVLANNNYLPTIMNDIKRLNEFSNERSKNDIMGNEFHSPMLKFKPWVMATYYHMGFIGRLVPSRYLLVYANFMKVFYDQIPVDWGYRYLIMMMGLERLVQPELFVHIGKQSSSKGT